MSKKKFLPHAVRRKQNSHCKTSLWPTEATHLSQTNIEVEHIYIVSAKSELNLQQLKHFHMHLKMLEIALPRTKLSKFPGGAYPQTPLDTPVFEGFCFRPPQVSLNPKSALSKGSGSHLYTIS